MECERKKTGIFCSVSQPANNGRLDKFQTLKEFRQAQLKIGKVCGQTLTVGGGSLQKHLPGWRNKAQSVKMGTRATMSMQEEAPPPPSFLSIANKQSVTSRLDS